MSILLFIPHCPFLLMLMTFLTSATAALWYQSHLPHIPVRVLSEDDELRRVVAEMGGSKHLPLLESSLWILAS